MNDIIKSEEDEDKDGLASYLSLGSKSYPLQIPPVTSPPPLAAGPMTHPESSSSSWLSNSFNQRESSSLPGFTTWLQYESSSSNQTNPAMTVNTVSSSRSDQTIQLPSVADAQPRVWGQLTPQIRPWPPYPWATNDKGRIHTLEYLESYQITTITGDVECSYCQNEYKVSYNLRESFAEVEMIFLKTKSEMRERAPLMWTKPEKRRCDLCGHENSVKPKIAIRKREINWLFMLLGQTLGHSTLKQLKNFCKHSNIHRTGALDRVLYLTYLGLSRMLQPTNLLFLH